jgi:MFS family permease
MTKISRSTRFTPWIAVWLCFATLAIAMSARQSPSIMTNEWVQSLTWSRTFIGSGQSVALIITALVVPITGNLADRYSVRAMLCGGLLLVALGLLLLAVFPVPALYLVGYGVVGGVGFAGANYHLISTGVARLFEKRQGLAMGIANAGGTAGQFVTVPLLTTALTYVSWRWGVIAVALSCAIMAVVIWVMFKSAESDADQVAETAPREPLRNRLKLLFTDTTFHILFWSYFICGITTTGVIETHFLPYAAFCGFRPVPASGIYGFIMAVNFGGMFLIGWLTDRMNRPLLLGSIYLVRALSFVVLMFVGTSYEMMLLFAVIFGIVDYSTLPPTASLVASHLGVRVMGLALGIITCGHSLGGALGAFLGGYLFDLFARYAEMWWVAFGTAGLAGVMVFALRESRRGRFYFGAA